MPSLIPNIPISFIKSKHPSIFTHIIFRKKNLNGTCNKSFKQPGKHSPLSRTRSGETLASLKQRALAQARHATRGLHELSLRRDAVLTETANSRPGETRDSGGFTRSRSGEAFSPERDSASLKTGKGRLGEFSWQ